MCLIKLSIAGASFQASLKTFPVDGGWMGGEKLGLKFNSAQLELEAELGKNSSVSQPDLKVSELGKNKCDPIFLFLNFLFKRNFSRKISLIK